LDRIEQVPINDGGLLARQGPALEGNLSSPPARATVEVARLPRDVKIEISAIAVRP
jgi:enamine deaminase RidA (YjgF/YER057c/UK114 family)